MSHPSEPTPQEIDLNLVRQYLSSRTADQQMLGRLEGATAQLSSEVAGLRTALSTYATKGDVATLDESHTERVRIETEDRLKALVALRLKIRRQTWILFGIATLLFIGACIVGALALRSNHKALTSYRHDRYAACLLRNSTSRQTTQTERTYFRPLLAQEKTEAHPDPVVVAVLQGLVNAQPQIITCTR